MKTCLYCCKEKHENEFSKEHAIPKSVGGAISPENPFLLDNVCKRCNNLTGRIIDGPFVKNYYLKGIKATTTNKFVRLNKNTILPFEYIGKLTNFAFNEKECELWLGPDKSRIYHIHEPYAVRELPPLNINQKDIVFIFIKTNNPNWEIAIFNSLRANFKRSSFYIGNTKPPLGSIFERIPKSLSKVYDYLIIMQSQSKLPISFGFTTELYFADRFFAKLALGIGSKVLGKSFEKSNSAQKLRDYMWTKDFFERQKINIVKIDTVRSYPLNTEDYLNFWDNEKSNRKWEGGHLIILEPEDDTLFLYANFYESSASLVLLSNEKNLWEDIIGQGLCYVIVPGLQTGVGPIPLPDFAEHVQGTTYKNKALLELEKEMDKYRTPPSFYL